MNRMNVVPFKAPDTFKRFGIDWTRNATTESERTLRESYLKYETSCGPNGLVSVLLLATVSRRQGSVAADLQAAADFSEVILAMKLREHQTNTVEQVHTHLANGGTV
jgi:hypothetical protein